jgi:hypothetical protein
MFVRHRRHPLRAFTACYRDRLTLYMQTMLILRRKHIYRPLRPSTGISLLFTLSLARWADAVLVAMWRSGTSRDPLHEVLRHRLSVTFRWLLEHFLFPMGGGSRAPGGGARIFRLKQTNKQTPWPLFRERTIPTDRPPLVDEI